MSLPQAFRAVTCTAVALLMFTPQATAQKSKNPSIKPTVANYKYGPHERNVLDFYQAESDTPTPVVVFIHGGGFRKGSKEPVASSGSLKYLLADGISVAAFHYRFIEHAPLPAAHHDCRRALQTLRSKAKEWNIDKTKFGLMGGSAGAQVCMYLGFHDDMADPDSDDPIERESTRVSAVASFAGQTTLDAEWWQKNIPGYEAPHRNFHETVGAKTKEEYLATIRDLSALSLISKDDPPIYMDYVMAPDAPIPSGKKAGNWKIHHVNFGVALKKEMDKLNIVAELKFPGIKTQHQNKVEFFKEYLKTGSR